MRGRRPHPTAVRILRGNPSRRPLNLDEPKHPPIDVEDVPAELADPIAIGEWQRLIPSLTKTGHLQTVDRAALIAYCVKYGQWQTLEQQAAKDGLIVDGKPHPAIALANKTLVVLLRAAADLGLTPTSRARVVGAPQTQPDADAFAAFQRKRRQD